MTFIDRRFWAMLAAAALLWSIAWTALAVTPDDYNPENPSALEGDHLYAEAAFLFDMDTGEILLSKNSRVRMYPASTTKIMTLLLALESGIPLDQTVTVPREADDVPEGSSVIGIRSGDTLTWRDLLYGFMLQSGHDGSNAIAVLTAGTIDAFVQRMNVRAAELNCEGTHYTNAHGYHDSDHYTTAQDLARISMYAMQNEIFRDIVAQPRWDVTVTRGGKTGSKVQENRNSLVVPESDYYYPGANGIKTGHHNKAGWCVVASAERQGVRLMEVVLNCATEEKKWQDAKKLFDYGFSQYDDVTMADLLGRLQGELCTASIENAAEADPEGGRMALSLGEISGGNVTRRLQRNSQKALEWALNDIRSSAQIEWSRPLTAPVRAGEQLGILRFNAPDGTAISAPLMATRDVEAQPVATATPEPTLAPVEPATAGGSMETPAPSRRRGPAPGVIAAFLGLGLIAVLCVAVRAQVEKKRRARRRRRPSTGRRNATAASRRRTPPARRSATAQRRNVDRERVRRR